MKPFWLLLALGALAAAWRWRSVGRTGRTLLLLLGVGLALVGTGVVAVPTAEQVVKEVGGRLGAWTYLLVGVSAFLETGAFLGFVAPGETMVLFGGVLAGEGTIELVPLIILVWACAYLGDVCAYVIGRRYGREFLLRHGERVKIGEPQVQFVEGFFERHGDMTVLIGRWIGVVRPLVPFLAGSSRLPAARFLAVDFVAAGVWAAALSVLGSVFWQNFDQLTSLVGQALFVFGSVVFVAAVVGFAVAARRSEHRNAAVEEWIAAQVDAHPVVGRVAGAAWALNVRLEPHVPGRTAESRTSARAGTVSPEEAGKSAGSSSTDHPAE